MRNSASRWFQTCHVYRHFMHFLYVPSQTSNVCRILHFPGFYSIFGGPHRTIESRFTVCL